MNNPDYAAVTQAIAVPDDQPFTAMNALCDFARSVIGHKLFTLMVFDADTQEASRFYSNMPDAYPVSGKKPADKTKWSGIVMDQHKTFVANTIEEIAEVFPDFELIKSLGCESVVNIPIFVSGRFLGTINCLDEAGHYTPERVAASEALKLPGVACFLIHYSNANGDR